MPFATTIRMDGKEVLTFTHLKNDRVQLRSLFEDEDFGEAFIPK